MMIYRCDPSIEGILCGVYEGWRYEGGRDQVQLVLKDAYEELQLFAQYCDVPVEASKAKRAAAGISSQFSHETYERIYIASLSWDPERADKIFQFIYQGFPYGAAALDMLQLPASQALFTLYRNVTNENHRMVEFLRFSQTIEGILTAKIEPKNDILTILAPHFADRFPQERWVIYDAAHKKAGIHLPGERWFLVSGLGKEGAEKRFFLSALERQSDEAMYQELWRTFCQAISIKERENPSCQMSHLPLRFRPNMTEFQ